MYEVGDKVIYQGADKSAYKKVGILKSIEEKDGKPQLTVEFEGGETFTAPVDDWSKEFTNAVTNAEFKVGDFVKIISGDMKGQRAVITKITGDVVEVKDNDGYKWEVGQEDIVANSRACRSTNSVVRNAIFLLNRKVVKNDAYSDYMRFVNKWRGVVADMERKLQSCKREAPSDATLVVSGQIDDAINEVHTVSQWLENTRYLSREDFEF